MSDSSDDEWGGHALFLATVRGALGAHGGAAMQATMQAAEALAEEVDADLAPGAPDARPVYAYEAFRHVTPRVQWTRDDVHDAEVDAALRAFAERIQAGQAAHRALRRASQAAAHGAATAHLTASPGDVDGARAAAVAAAEAARATAPTQDMLTLACAPEPAHEAEQGGMPVDAAAFWKLFDTMSSNVLRRVVWSRP